MTLPFSATAGRKIFQHRKGTSSLIPFAVMRIDRFWARCSIKTKLLIRTCNHSSISGLHIFTPHFQIQMFTCITLLLSAPYFNRPILIAPRILISRVSDNRASPFSSRISWKVSFQATPMRRKSEAVSKKALKRMKDSGGVSLKPAVSKL